jgi:two-component system response regulator AtoC
VQIDCASLPRELIEAELFGHEKGAYTGAQGARAGLLEAAEGGTAFLDEIGELPLDMQAKLLNVIERRVVRRVGSVRERPIAARFVAGTNRDLPAMIAAGQFRADLYYRLNVVTLTMPPLRERGNDVTLLARHFAAQTARRYALDEPGFDPVALSALQRYHWPGNVRELKHLIERAVLLCQGRDIGAADLGLPSAATAGADAAAVPFASMTLDEAERWLIERTLDRVRGNVSEAARRLGVSRMTLRYRIEKHGLRGAVDD